ncbi:hypothetical protein SK128_017828 [Halocaridina rubra]|uniref:Uncharacterized protein n=1 Tax=Halocaridina rubra TaxID=373956 RepID=A0AAN8X791_HALRR
MCLVPIDGFSELQILITTLSSNKVLVPTGGGFEITVREERDPLEAALLLCVCHIDSDLSGYCVASGFCDHWQRFYEWRCVLFLLRAKRGCCLRQRE